MARALAKREPRAKETDYAAQFEAPEFLTLGVLYAKDGRFAGGAYSSFLKKVDRFSDRTLAVSLREREGYASRLRDIDIAGAQDHQVAGGARLQVAVPAHLRRGAHQPGALPSHQAGRQEAADADRGGAHAHDGRREGIRRRQGAVGGPGAGRGAVERMKATLVAALRSALVLAALAGCTSAARVQVDRDVAVPMRDGVVLRADIYRPARGGPVPGPRLSHALRQAQRGARAIAFTGKPSSAAMRSSCRTCAAAMPRTGTSIPTGRKARTATTRSSGRRRRPGRMAGSARTAFPIPGAVQWLAAMEAPPHLLAMAPAMTFSSPRRFFYMNGIFDRRGCRGSTSTSRRTRDAGLGCRWAAMRRRSWPAVARRATSPGCRCATCPGCDRKRRTTSSGWRIRPRIRGGTGRNCAAATGESRPPCST